MKHIKAFVREEQLTAILAALRSAEVPGLTVTKAVGIGSHPATSFYYRGVPYTALRPVCVLDILAPDDRADEFVLLLLKHARTGLAGDGHVIVTPVEDAYAVKSGWREVA